MESTRKKIQRKNAEAVRRECSSHACGIVSGIHTQKFTCFRRIEKHLEHLKNGFGII